MLFKDHAGMIACTIISLSMGVFMAVTAMILDSLEISIWVFLSLCGTITWLTLVCLILIPAPMWGNKLASALKCRPGSLAFILVSGVVPALIINTVCSLVMAAINIFGSSEIPAGMKLEIWESSVLHDWPIMLVISYLCALIAGQLGSILVKKSLPQDS